MASSIALMARDHLSAILAYQLVSTVVSGFVLVMIWQGGI